MVENHLVLFSGNVLKADERTVWMLNISTQTLLYNQVFDSPLMSFFIDINVCFLRVPIQIHPKNQSST